MTDTTRPAHPAETVIRKPRIHPIAGEPIAETAKRMMANLRDIFAWQAEQEEILVLWGDKDPRLDPEFIEWWKSHPPLASENWS